MAQLVSYEVNDGIATIAMDDGKANAMSLAMLDELNTALDEAETGSAVVVVTGRSGVFSAGFDLPTLRGGGSKAVRMVRAGFDLAERILSFPRPVVMVCTGHAVAMGVFLLLSGDYRLGSPGAYRLMANEVAIGLTMPHAAVEVLRQRLTPAAFNRAVTLAEPFSADDAVDAGFLDRLVEETDLRDVSRAVALELSRLDVDAHAESKLRARAQSLQALRAAIDTDYATLSLRG